MKIPPFIQFALFALSFLPGFGQVAKENIEGYRLKAGDEIHLSVYGEEDLEKKTLLSQSGDATFLFIENQRLAGLTLAEADQKITEAYDDGWLVNPKVTIELIKAADETITVMGAVAKPDQFVIPQGPGQGLDLTSALAQAGGLNASADPAKITVKRGGQQQTYHYASITSSKAQPIMLINGDIIEVGINPNIGAVVSVIGEVKNPGPVGYQPNLDVQVALGTRGGPSANAATGGYWIKRGNSRISASLSTKMMPGDVLTIPLNPLVGKSVMVAGEVNRPMAVPFELDGKMSILEAITKAGGEKESGNLSKITVLRSQRAIRVNLTDMKAGKLPMFMMEPGDSVSVPQRAW